MNAYVWVKSLHLLFVMGWVAAAFYLPRILINLVEAGADVAVRDRLVLMGRRLVRFGHVMFGIAVLLGMVLWMHFGIAGGWMHVKLVLVALLFAHFIVGGRWVRRAASGAALPSTRALRWFNEVPVFGLLAIIVLVIGKPF